MTSKSKTTDIQLEELFQKVQQVLNERQEDYGNVISSFSNIALLWTNYLCTKHHTPITLMPEDISLMMILFKLCRETNHHKEDNIIDMMGYLALYYKLIQNEL